MATDNNWSDKIGFANFALALCGSANTWLDSQVTLEDITGDREKWTIIRPLFKAEFAIECISMISMYFIRLVRINLLGPWPCS